MHTVRILRTSVRDAAVVIGGLQVNVQCRRGEEARALIGRAAELRHDAERKLLLAQRLERAAEDLQAASRTHE